MKKFNSLEDLAKVKHAFIESEKKEKYIEHQKTVQANINKKKYWQYNACKHTFIQFDDDERVFFEGRLYEPEAWKDKYERIKDRYFFKPGRRKSIAEMQGLIL